MSNLYFISDHHFGHENVLKFGGRSAGTMLEHDEWLVAQHNSRVTDRDVVWFGGDVAWSPGALLAYLPQMKGTKRLILGNHDTLNMGLYLSQFDRVVGSYQRRNVMFTHIPVHPCEFDYRVRHNVHGHLHLRTLPLDDRYRSMCVEHCDGVPQTIAELIENSG